MESFVPPGGSLRRVVIYPSDYGLEVNSVDVTHLVNSLGQTSTFLVLQALKREERFGPQLWTEDDDEDNEDADHSSDDLGELEGGDGGRRTKVRLSMPRVAATPP